MCILHCPLFQEQCQYFIESVTDLTEECGFEDRQFRRPLQVGRLPVQVSKLAVRMFQRGKKDSKPSHEELCMWEGLNLVRLLTESRNSFQLGMCLIFEKSQVTNGGKKVNEQGIVAFVEQYGLEDVVTSCENECTGDRALRMKLRRRGNNRGHGSHSSHSSSSGSHSSSSESHSSSSESSSSSEESVSQESEEAHVLQTCLKAFKKKKFQIKRFQGFFNCMYATMIQVMENYGENCIGKITHSSTNIFSLFFKSIFRPVKDF